MKVRSTYVLIPVLSPVPVKGACFSVKGRVLAYVDPKKLRTFTRTFDIFSNGQFTLFQANFLQGETCRCHAFRAPATKPQVEHALHSSRAWDHG